MIRILSAAALTIFFGAIVNALDDSQKHSPAALISFMVAMIATLVGAGSLWSRTGIWAPLIALPLVFLAFLGSVTLFDASPLRQAIGIIRPGESNLELVRNSTLVRLWLCGFPTLLVGAMTLAIARRREVVVRFSVALGIGVLSAGLFGASYALNQPAWFRFSNWPKFLSAGLVLLVFVILAMTLARAISDHRNRRKAAPAQGSATGVSN